MNTFDNYKIILIDGNAGVGKTLFAKKLQRRFPDFEYLNLDQYKNIDIKHLVEKGLGEQSFDHFLKNYYKDDEMLRSIIADRKIIVEGCFSSLLDLDDACLVYINDSPKTRQNVLSRLIGENSSVSPQYIEAYNDTWNTIWDHYIVKYQIKTRAFHIIDQASDS
jgi:deoxyadenosine/deoxycytidine kinase